LHSPQPPPARPAETAVPWSCALAFCLCFACDLVSMGGGERGFLKRQLFDTQVTALRSFQEARATLDADAKQLANLGHTLIDPVSQPLPFTLAERLLFALQEGSSLASTHNCSATYRGCDRRYKQSSASAILRPERLARRARLPAHTGPVVPPPPLAAAARSLPKKRARSSHARTHKQHTHTQHQNSRPHRCRSVSRRGCTLSGASRSSPRRRRS
jgi:hypothetical protein